MKTIIIATIFLLFIKVQLQAIEWGPCPADEPVVSSFSAPWNIFQKPTKTNLTTECATIKVPAEYEKPEGPKIDLFIKKFKATANPKRGQLFLAAGFFFYLI
jgi:hypothetical protein